MLTALIAVWSLLVSLSLCQSPTTPYISEVFLGKCYERNPTGVNCTAIWEAFSSAAMIANNKVNISDYDPFFALANFSTPKDNILFWSGNQAFAIALANDGTSYTTIEETPTGYVLNGLSWCGVYDASPPRFDYTNPCYYPTNDTYVGTQSVWAESSKRFASEAKGHITIFLQPARLNYDSGPYEAFRNTSVFYQIELPSMIKSQITSATLLLIVNTTLAPGEHCGNGTIITLNQMFQEKFNFTPECIDEPQMIYRILCPDDSTATAQCLAAALAYGNSPDARTEKEKAYFVWALATTAGCATLLLLAIYFALRSNRAGYARVK